jgi:hypothetical protein
VVTVEYDDHKEPAIMSLAEAKEHALQYPGVDKQYVRGDVDSLTVYTSCQGSGLVVDCISKEPRPDPLENASSRWCNSEADKLSRNLMRTANCAVAAYLTQLPFKLVLSRNSDMEIVSSRRQSLFGGRAGQMCKPGRKTVDSLHDSMHLEGTENGCREYLS